MNREVSTIADIMHRRSSFHEESDYINTVGVQDVAESKIVTKIFDETQGGFFSDLSNPETIIQLCLREIPDWQALNTDDIEIRQLCEGLTNQNFKVYTTKAEAMAKGKACFLVRIYGRGVTEFYDPEVELRTFKMLANYEIAPEVIADGIGWRIEQWHCAVAVPTRLLHNPSISTQVAAHLGRMHKLGKRSDFPMPNGSPCLFSRLRDWSKKACSRELSPLELKKLGRVHLEKMEQEIDFLQDLVERESNKVCSAGDGYDVVFSHNDCQENNILQTQYGLKLIDFEYSTFNYQAYDIANFFCEHQLDYIIPVAPFFTIDLSAYPSETAQRLFLAVYLSEYLESTVLPDSPIVLNFLRSTQILSLASHLTWGFWSVLRAKQAPTCDEFDFLYYAKTRFDMYMRGKSTLKEKTRDYSKWISLVLAGALLVHCVTRK